MEELEMKEETAAADAKEVEKSAVHMIIMSSVLSDLIMLCLQKTPPRRHSRAATLKQRLQIRPETREALLNSARARCAKLKRPGGVVWSHGKEYCENTSLHGFGYWVGAPRYVNPVL